MTYTKPPGAMHPGAVVLYSDYSGVKSVDHALEVPGNGDGGSGSSLHLIHGELGVDLGHQQALGGNLQHAHLGDDLVNAVGGGQGQTALLEDLGVSCRVVCA